MSKTASELIEIGEEVSKKSKEPGAYGVGHVYSGVEYEKWASDIGFFLYDNEDEIPTPLYNKVNDAALNASGNGDDYFNTIIGFLRSFAERS